MELSEIYQKEDINRIRGFDLEHPKISFEVFPPKDGNISKLFDELRILKKYNPVLVSLTYGASGTSNRFSIEVLKSIVDLEYTLMPHLTCISASKAETEAHITAIENIGIENILALRGDITKENSGVYPRDFIHANELVEFIHHKTTLSIGVAGYPEGHIESKSLKDDIENLKKKVDAGASAIFTQLFFNNDKFYKYVEQVRKAGINLPIIPGIMPVRSLKQFDRITSMARVEIPQKLVEQLKNFPDDAKKIGVEFATNQCQNLIDFKVAGLHFYTLNHSDMTSEILDNLFFT